MKRLALCAGARISFGVCEHHRGQSRMRRSQPCRRLPPTLASTSTANGSSSRPSRGPAGTLRQELAAAPQPDDLRRPQVVRAHGRGCLPVLPPSSIARRSKGRSFACQFTVSNISGANMLSLSRSGLANSSSLLARDGRPRRWQSGSATVSVASCVHQSSARRAIGGRPKDERSAHQDGANLSSALIDRNDGELPLALHRQATQVVHDGLPLLDLAGRTAANLRRDSGAVQDPPWRE